MKILYLAKNDITKNNQKIAENGRKSLKVFDNWLRTGKNDLGYSWNWLKINTVAETAKNGFKCLKMH